MSKNLNLPENGNEERVRIEGVLFSHPNGDFGLWDGLCLSEEDENLIYSILNSYDTEGCSVRESSKKVLFEEELRLFDKNEEEKKEVYRLAEKVDSFVAQFGVPDYEENYCLAFLDGLLVGIGLLNPESYHNFLKGGCMR